MNQKKIIIFEIIICILIKVALYLTAYYVYAGIFNIAIIENLLTSWIVVTLLSWKKETNTDRPRFRWFTFVLIGIVLILFVIYKPDYTYEEGKNIAISQGYENIYELQDKQMIGFGMEHTFFVRNAYLYGGQKDKEKYYILISPINGEIKTEEMGVGNYLDKYFEMKYSQQ